MEAGKSVPEERFAVAEAAFVDDPELQNLAAYKSFSMPNVRTGALVIVYLSPDYDRFIVDESGQVATLYTGRRYDAYTLAPLGTPKRSNDPAELRAWWKRQTGNPASSPALGPPGPSGKG